MFIAFFASALLSFNFVFAIPLLVQPGRNDRRACHYARKSTTRQRARLSHD